jgi:hypothetical protein
VRRAAQTGRQGIVFHGCGEAGTTMLAANGTAGGRAWQSPSPLRLVGASLEAQISGPRFAHGMSDVNDEVAQIEHELGVLRSRYALMERSARITKVAFIVFLVIMAALAIFAIAEWNVPAIFMSLIILVAAALQVLLFPNTRWIDIVTPEPFAARTFARRTSEAEIVESQIAKRELRLADIKGTSSSPGS